jgi:hypothetical protein
MSRPVALLLVLLSALALGACGNREDGPTTEAETEGIYLEVDELKYQVQTSRQLNPLTVDDQSYLQGLAPEDAALRPDEEFFAIFLRVENETDEAHTSAVDFEIRDTQENVYTPLEYEQRRDRNFFVYRAGVVPPGDLVPNPDSAPGERPPFGSILLFKVRRFSLDNRPLELIVKGRRAPQVEGTINLDV